MNDMMRVSHGESVELIAPLAESCFANVLSGELVLAVFVGRDVFIRDEYGGHFWMARDDFDRRYDSSPVCAAV